MLLGRKDPQGGGAYADKWHLIGGGVEPNESLLDAAVREFGEEVTGLNVSVRDLEELGYLKGAGGTTKVLPDGSKVWCEMDFNYSRMVSNKSASELIKSIKPGSDLVELKFFDREALSRLDRHPGGVEDRIISGALTPTSGTENE